MSYQLGVDLGTTFVAAAVAHPGQVEMFTLGDRSVVAPSVVYRSDGGELVTGEAAGRRLVSNPDRVSREFKRRLGDPTPVVLGGESYQVTELLGAALRDVLDRVTEAQGAAPDRVVLTHPANWGPFRRGLFEEMPGLVGLTDVDLVTEPEAAAAHYAATRELADGDTVAVYDLGGGTFDATVLRRCPDGVEILGTPEGIERLGGVDFDEAILAHLDHVTDGALSELDPRDPKTTTALARLRLDCVLAKESLSVDFEAVIPVFLPDRHFDVTLTRGEFEDLIRAPVESTIGALACTLRSAQVTPDELSAVLLVGGSSRIPLVARMVSEELGRPTVVDTHPKYAVALGAATLAAATVPHGAVAHGAGAAQCGRPIDPPPAAPKQPSPDSAGADASPSRGRSRWVRGAAAVAVVGLVGLVGAGLWWSARPDDPQSAPPTTAAPARPTVAPPAVLTQIRHIPIRPGTTMSLIDGPELRYGALSASTWEVLNAETLAPVWKVDLPLPVSPRRWVWAMDGSRTCIQAASDQCMVVNQDSRHVENLVNTPAQLDWARFVDQGRTLVTVTAPGILTVADLTTGASRSVPIGGARPVDGFELLCKDGRAYLTTNSGTPELKVVDLATMEVRTIAWAADPTDGDSVPRAQSLNPSRDGRWLYARAPRGVLVFDTARMALDRRIPQDRDLGATLRLSPDTRFLALVTSDGELRVLDAVSGERLSTGRTLTGPISWLQGGRLLQVSTAQGRDVFDTAAFAAN